MSFLCDYYRRYHIMTRWTSVPIILFTRHRCYRLLRYPTHLSASPTCSIQFPVSLALTTKHKIRCNPKAYNRVLHSCVCFMPAHLAEHPPLHPTHPRRRLIHDNSIMHFFAVPRPNSFSLTPHQLFLTSTRVLLIKLLGRHAAWLT
jgi:hypothetical protein